MFLIRLLIAGVIVVLFVSACASTSVEPKGRVYCPACHIELDALFEKHY